MRSNSANSYFLADALGRRTSLSTTRNGSAWDTTTWVCDPETGLATAKTYADDSVVSFTHTPDGLPLRTTWARGAWREDAYGADRRLAAVSHSDGTPSIAYVRDSFGRMTNAALSSGRSSGYSYDADDNLVSDGERTFAWDAENRLISVTPDYPEEGSLRVRNDYDHLSRRVAKHVDTWDAVAEAWMPGETRTFVYDGWTPILETIVNHVAGTTNTVRYLWGLDLSETLQGAGGVGGLVAVIRDGAAYFPCYDANGNITEYVSESGAVVASYVYDAFGNLLSAFGPMADEFSHRFSTKYFDPETGLYYYGYRFYVPLLGRWINRDPIEEEGGENLYVFVKNNPNSKVDALGTTDYCSCLIITELSVAYVNHALNFRRTKHTYVNIGNGSEIPRSRKTGRFCDWLDFIKITIEPSIGVNAFFDNDTSVRGGKCALRTGRDIRTNLGRYRPELLYWPIVEFSLGNRGSSRSPLWQVGTSMDGKGAMTTGTTFLLKNAASGETLDLNVSIGGSAGATDDDTIHFHFTIK